MQSEQRPWETFIFKEGGGEREEGDGERGRAQRRNEDKEGCVSTKEKCLKNYHKKY